MKAIKNILIAYDFSEIGRQALQRAIVLSARHHASLTVLYVMEEIPREILKLIEFSEETGSKIKKTLFSEIQNLIGSSGEKIKSKIVTSYSYFRAESGNRTRGLVLTKYLLYH